jgi:cyclohexanone monooxygenase
VADLDVVVVGAGFAGLYAVHALRSSGLMVRAFEAGSGIGGTWFWNSYPGARCDVESKDYSYSFSPELEQEWSWSERYPAQPEILRYLNHVADRFGLWPDLRLSTRVTSAVWDAAAAEWAVTTDDGAAVSARFIVSAVGCLSAYQVPSLPGLDTFAGPWYHTARWPAEGVDFTGKRVGLIGTGSTGIQIAPEIAAVASRLYVFQRTPNFAAPNRNRPWEPDAELEFKSRYRQYRKEARESFLDCIGYLSAHGYATAEATADAEAAWMEHVTEVAYSTLFPQAESWYLGANIPGKPRVFTTYVGGVGPYGAKCDQVAAAGYEGFALGMSLSLNVGLST